MLTFFSLSLLLTITSPIFSAAAGGRGVEFQALALKNPQNQSDFVANGLFCAIAQNVSPAELQEKISQVKTFNPQGLECGDAQQNTPLYWATALGKEAFVEQLTQNGANPSARNQFGGTVLGVSILNHKNPALVARLLAAKADPNGTSLDNPLTTACSQAKPWAVGQLLQAGVCMSPQPPITQKSTGKTFTPKEWLIFQATQDSSNPAWHQSAKLIDKHVASLHHQEDLKRQKFVSELDGLLIFDLLDFSGHLYCLYDGISHLPEREQEEKLQKDRRNAFLKKTTGERFKLLTAPKKP
jgi:hypothetical protein